MVPLTGFEPVRYRYRGILSPLRLPVSPQRHRKIIAKRRREVKRVGTLRKNSFGKDCAQTGRKTEKKRADGARRARESTFYRNSTNFYPRYLTAARVRDTMIVQNICEVEL